MKTSTPGSKPHQGEQDEKPAASATRIPTQPNITKLSARDLVSIQDFSPEEIKATLELALLMKRHPNDFLGALVGKQQVLFSRSPHSAPVSVSRPGWQASAVSRFSSTRHIAASMPEPLRHRAQCRAMG
jgi:hypothetical protein